MLTECVQLPPQGIQILISKMGSGYYFTNPNAYLYALVIGVSKTCHQLLLCTRPLTVISSMGVAALLTAQN